MFCRLRQTAVSFWELSPPVVKTTLRYSLYSRARLWHQAEATLHETLSRIVLLLGHFSLPDLSPRTLTRSWVAFLDKPLVQGSSSQSLSWKTPPKHQLNPQALCDTVPGPLR